MPPAASLSSTVSSDHPMMPLLGYRHITNWLILVFPLSLRKGLTNSHLRDGVERKLRQQ
jgi:hypothetical protein